MFLITCYVLSLGKFVDVIFENISGIVQITRKFQSVVVLSLRPSCSKNLLTIHPYFSVNRKPTKSRHKFNLLVDGNDNV